MRWLSEWDLTYKEILEMKPEDVRNRAFDKIWKEDQMDRLQKEHVDRFGRKAMNGIENYLTLPWSFKMTRAVLAFRIRSTPWSMSHRFRYEAGELLPPCHLCHTPTQELESHLLFQCDQIQDFRVEFPVLHTRKDSLDNMLRNPSHAVALHLLRFYYAVQRAKPKTKYPQALPLDEGSISDSSEEEDESCISQAEHRLYTVRRNM